MLIDLLFYALFSPEMKKRERIYPKCVFLKLFQSILLKKDLQKNSLRGHDERVVYICIVVAELLSIRIQGDVI